MQICLAAITLFGASLFVNTAAAQDWQLCPQNAKRFTCVVDGDTFWYQGTKMRLLGVDTPELAGRCQNERQVAHQATKALLAFLKTGVREISIAGKDRYGRALVEVTVASGRVGPQLLAAGLAEPYPRRGRSPWCGE